MSEKHVNKQEHQCHRCLEYTALGNSIAFGVGATDNYGYVNYFRDFLATMVKRVNLINRAVPGFTSSDLLHQLQNDATTRNAVKNADLITISIGGNNLLDCMNAPNPPECLTNGVATFANDWPQILEEIRHSIGSKAQILVMTVYNPFRGDDPNYKIVEPFIQQINNVINKEVYRSLYKYKVVDVHADFQGKFTDGRWKVCTWTHFCESPPNPHPTDCGHLEIARLHELVFLKNC